MKKTDVLLKDYILSGKLKYNTSPSLGYCAKILQLSSHYFNDLLKFESGKNIDEYFESKRLEMAKSMLLDSNNTVSVVTEKLGYPNIRYFSRLFKRITGVAPNNDRLSQNEKLFLIIMEELHHVTPPLFLRQQPMLDKKPASHPNSFS